MDQPAITALQQENQHLQQRIAELERERDEARKLAADMQTERDEAVASYYEEAARVAVVVEEAAKLLEERGSDGWAEHVMAEYASTMSESIRALVTDSEPDALAERDKRIREEERKQIYCRLMELCEGEEALRDASDRTAKIMHGYAAYVLRQAAAAIRRRGERQ